MDRLRGRVKVVASSLICLPNVDAGGTRRAELALGANPKPHKTLKPSAAGVLQGAMVALRVADGGGQVICIMCNSA